MLLDASLEDQRRADRAKARRTQDRAQRQRAAELSQPDAGVQDGSDVGVGLAVRRGLVEVSRNAHIPHDPDAKRGNAVIGTRGQKVWAPDRLLWPRGNSQPAIGQWQHDAALRYYNDFLIGEMGAQPGDLRGVGRRDPWDRMPYNERRAMARQSWERATMAVGAQFIGILVWTVLQLPSRDRADVPPTVESWAKSVEWSTERAVGFLAGALEALAVHYGFTKGNSPSARRARSRED